MNIAVDIDGTICETEGTDYPNARPIQERIEAINRLYDQGHTIIYWTARGVGSGEDQTLLTKTQLHTWGAKYHHLFLKKAPFDVIIDDRAFNARDIEDAIRYIDNETERDFSLHRSGKIDS